MKDYYTNSNMLYFDCPCKNGANLVNVLEQRLENNNSIRDSLNTLFGIDSSEDNVFMTKRNLHNVVADFLERSTISHKSNKWFNIIEKCGMIIENNIFQVTDCKEYVRKNKINKKMFAYYDPKNKGQIKKEQEKEKLLLTVKNKIKLGLNGTKNELCGYFLF